MLVGGILVVEYTRREPAGLYGGKSIRAKISIIDLKERFNPI